MLEARTRPQPILKQNPDAIYGNRLVMAAEIVLQQANHFELLAIRGVHSDFRCVVKQGNIRQELTGLLSRIRDQLEESGSCIGCIIKPVENRRQRRYDRSLRLPGPPPFLSSWP